MPSIFGDFVQGVQVVQLMTCQQSNLINIGFVYLVMQTPWVASFSKLLPFDFLFSFATNEHSTVL